MRQSAKRTWWAWLRRHDRGEATGEKHAASREKRSAAQESTSGAWLREIVEAICVALILAFLFRTFEAEAFVIPTGSMAPTLMGRHKDLVCDECGYPFQVGTSEEVDKENGHATGKLVVGGTCPNCRHTMSVGPNQPDGQEFPSYKGDRILVTKYAYHLHEPERWDVIVFKYPGAAATNFIKRLIGLPNETVRIHHGDIWIRDDKNGDGDFHIARKPPKKIIAMMQPVYDAEYSAADLAEAGWPPRWSVDGAGHKEHWETSGWGRSFETGGQAPGDTWIRYQHLTPTWDDWERIESGLPISADAPKPRLISDFVAYNTNDSVDLRRVDYRRGPIEPAAPRGEQLGLDWVGDLIVECRVTVAGDQGEVLLDLVESGRHFTCRIDVSSGEARFLVDDQELAREPTRLRGPGTYDLRYANVDDQLVLWVNGRPTVIAYDGQPWRPPEIDDRDRPVRIGSRDVALSVERLRVFRDIYYIAHTRASQSPMYDFAVEKSPFRMLPVTPYMGDQFRKMVEDLMWNPQRWETFANGNMLEFTMEEDQFFVLGDNSPQSEDGRFWRHEHFVRRELLIGKALAVIWPHSLDHIPGTAIPFPYFPNFQRMKLVR